MKRLLFSLFAFLTLLRPALAVNFPEYQNYVNDYAGIFSPDFEAGLNSQLSQLDQNTTNQIAVVTIKSLEGTTVEEYAVKLFEKWGIGQKDQDNGLLLLIAPNDKKVRIEVGYGLEGTITDGTAGYVLDNYLLPDFKSGKFEAGTQKTIDTLQKYLADPSQIPPGSTGANVDKFNNFYFFLILLFSGFPIYLLAYLTRSREIVTGGIVGLIIGYLLGGFLIALFYGLFGLILDWILSRNFKRLQSLGLPTDFWRSRGGFGGGWGGGGGFGGFGGGGSGGGGSSRGW